MSINLLPCPFCGHEYPEFERMGDRRQSCIVICGWCGARHESSDEGDRCGSSWNQRAEPGQDGLRKSLETALARIEDMLADDDGQAFKEARKFLPVGRAALAAQPGAVGETVTDAVCDALIQAWTLGQYYHGYNDRDDQLGAFKAQETHTKFVALLDKTRAMLAAAPTEAKPVQDAVDAELETYDAGLLNDFGGGNVQWWQDYIRAELGRAHDFYQTQCAAISAKKGGAA